MGPSATLRLAITAFFLIQLQLVRKECSALQSICCLNYLDSYGYYGENEIFRGDCRRITVYYTIKNRIYKPFFYHTIRLHRQQDQFIHFMEAAAMKKKRFQFSAEYLSNYGFVISAINGIKWSSSPQRRWKYKLSKGKIYTGVSHFIPKNGDHVIFEYVQS